MTEKDLRQLRAAKNQALFRSVNARLLDLNQTFERLTDRSVFVCECADLECADGIDMTLQDYERVRANPRRFIVAPSAEHVVPEVERVVERHDNYFVVEKIGVGARVAESASDAGPASPSDRFVA
jgi:hypothetical protein